jgi:hypothetical protein
LAVANGELVPEGRNLGLRLETRPDGRPDGGQQGDEEPGHSAADPISLGPELQRAQQVLDFW